MLPAAFLCILLGPPPHLPHASITESPEPSAECARTAAAGTSVLAAGTPLLAEVELCTEHTALQGFAGVCSLPAVFRLR